MATSKGTMFDPTLVKDLITKVKGKSALAALCGQTPIPFNSLTRTMGCVRRRNDRRRIRQRNYRKVSGN